MDNNRNKIPVYWRDRFNSYEEYIDEKLEYNKPEYHEDDSSYVEEEEKEDSSE